MFLRNNKVEPLQVPGDCREFKDALEAYADFQLSCVQRLASHVVDGVGYASLVEQAT